MSFDGSREESKNVQNNLQNYLHGYSPLIFYTGGLFPTIRDTLASGVTKHVYEICNESIIPFDVIFCSY